MEAEEEKEIENIINNSTTELQLPGKKKSKRQRHARSTKGNMHQEIKTTMGDGFQTIEITEVHIGHSPDDHKHGKNNIHGLPHGMPFMGMGMPTIIISKPRNLKMRGEKASPFIMMQSKFICDYFFRNG
jgi:hypothetical protein